MRWIILTVSGVLVAFPSTPLAAQDVKSLQEKFQKLVGDPWRPNGAADLQKRLDELIKELPPKQREAVLKYFDKLRNPTPREQLKELGDESEPNKFQKLVDEWKRLGLVERNDRLNELIKELPPRQREAIINYFEQLSKLKGRELFNGKDLDGWDTWLGKPYKGDKAIGLNQDPDKVFTVVELDGKPAIRVSGQTFGALTSRQEHENYHLKLEFKWGEKRWPPREKAARDSGLLYHCVGKHGAGGGFWMRSLECQIQEKDCGDFWSVDGVLVDVETEKIDGKRPFTYKRGAAKRTFGTKEFGARVVKSPDNEKPTGQWNTIELYTVGPTSVHMVNGKVVMILTNPRHMVAGKEEPLTKGRIQLQSEGAEVFYRNITIRPIDVIPADILK